MRPRPCRCRVGPNRHRICVRGLLNCVADRFGNLQDLKEMFAKMRGPKHEPFTDQMLTAVLDPGQLLELRMHIHPNFRSMVL